MTSRNHPHRLSLLLAGTALVTMAALPQSSFADPLRGSGAMVVAQAAPAENAPADNKREQRKPQERSNQQPQRQEQRQQERATQQQQKQQERTTQQQQRQVLMACS